LVEDVGLPLNEKVTPAEGVVVFEGYGGAVTVQFPGFTPIAPSEIKIDGMTNMKKAAAAAKAPAGLERKAKAAEAKAAKAAAIQTAKAAKSADITTMLALLDSVSMKAHAALKAKKQAAKKRAHEEYGLTALDCTPSPAMARYRCRRPLARWHLPRTPSLWPRSGAPCFFQYGAPSSSGIYIQLPL
jgi:hypothetical protein